MPPNKRLVSFIAVLLLGTGVWWWTGSPYRGVTNLAARGRTVVVLGDSIPAGYGEGVGPDRAWPALVANRLHLDLINRSVPGDTTDRGLKRLDEDVLAAHPRLVIVELGGNDMLDRRDVADSEHDLKTIFERIQAQGAMVMFVAVPAPFGDYGSAFRRACRHRGAYYVPNVLHGILSDRDRMVDEIHPNAAGHEMVADRMEKEVRGLLEAGNRARGGA